MVDVPLDTVPVYVRAGSVIPRLGEDRSLELWVYPGADRACWLYDDDGESYDYEGGAYRRVKVTYTDADRCVHLAAAEGDGVRQPGRRRQWLVDGTIVRFVSPDGRPLRTADGERASLRYEGREVAVYLDAGLGYLGTP
ncbi:DUF5110 domain-containing protein [Phytohabitans rumicis]|uniref:DUF5110 domain-containing protein n=1 Tax=Phytohabitans rumicis TaxID=1076125 RepID=A0A6V8LG79_9ACTN|nr:DUF5110 domain-containing protein [Phytohabitans rumicis]GFJ93841.1 hypothetical protein Prum_074830 [Phytohabitans rumicis]